MPGYVEKALHKYQHPPPARPEHSPSPYTQISYDSKSAQLTKPPDLSRQLTDKEIAHLQGITGTFLFYGRAIDSTMLVALSSLAAATNSATLNTAKALTQFLNYDAATHPDATITYHASDMILHTHSDASYLSEPKARSRASGIHYLSNRQYDNVDNINTAPSSSSAKS